MKSLPNVKLRYAAIALGFGALSTLVAVWGEMGMLLDTLPTLTPILSGETTFYMILSAVLIAPFIEELAKPIGLYFIHGEERAYMTPEEWAFLGALAGLGFAIVENILYAATMYPYGPAPALMLLGLRFMLPLHMIASAISGFGFGLWLRTRKAKYFAACIFISMLLHGAYNLAATVVG